MAARIRLMLGISVFWLALSMLFDGLNALVLPARLLAFTDETNQTTMLGLATFVGIRLGMVVQPIAGVYSDRWGRRGTIAFGVVLMLAALVLFGLSMTLLYGIQWLGILGALAAVTAGAALLLRRSRGIK